MNKSKQILTLSRVSLTYPDGTQVLDNVSFSIQAGSFVSILGPSGCGKTSLFHCISGLIAPNKGSIRVSHVNASSRIGAFGYSFQEPLLLPHRSVLENLLLGSELRHENKKQSVQRAREVLKHFGLTKFESYYPHALSGGMQQRVALLRTILFRNDFLLLDEPFGALDALTRLSAQEWLLRVWDEYKSTVLFITHDVSEALLLSDVVFLFSNRPSRIIQRIVIPFTRPRRHEMLRSKSGIALEKKIMKHIFSQTV